MGRKAGIGHSFEVWPTLRQDLSSSTGGRELGEEGIGGANARGGSRASPTAAGVRFISRKANRDSKSPKADLIDRVTRALGVLAASAAILYVLGGIGYALTLKHEHLPATAIVAQLPREFLLTVTLKVFGFALLAAMVVLIAIVFVLGSADSSTRRKVLPWVRRHRRPTVIAALLVGLVCLAAGMAIQSLLLGLPNTVACLTNKGEPLWGSYIGQTGDRTYIGEAHVTHPRIASIPNDEVGPVFIGGEVPSDHGRKLCNSFQPSSTSTTTTTP
jgi:hypothetical protein